MGFTKPFNKDDLNPVDKYLRLKLYFIVYICTITQVVSVYTWLLYKTGSEVLEVLF